MSSCSEELGQWSMVQDNDQSNEYKANVLGVFFGLVLVMEGKVEVKVHVLFYVLKEGESILSNHTCGKLGLISQDFPKIGVREHLLVPVELIQIQVNKAQGQESEKIFQTEGIRYPDSMAKQLTGLFSTVRRNNASRCDENMLLGT